MCVLPSPGVVSAEKQTTDNRSSLTTGDFSKKTFKKQIFKTKTNITKEAKFDIAYIQEARRGINGHQSQQIMGILVFSIQSSLRSSQSLCTAAQGTTPALHTALSLEMLQKNLHSISPLGMFRCMMRLPLHCECNCQPNDDEIHQGLINCRYPVASASFHTILDPITHFQHWSKRYLFSDPFPCSINIFLCTGLGANLRKTGLELVKAFGTTFCFSFEFVAFPPLLICEISHCLLRKGC